VKFYEGKDSFACITNPELKLKSSQVNDNSCDCPDGSDEPGTAACAHINTLSPAQPLPGSTSGTTNATLALPGFWCANAGHIGAYVPFMYVNDGVCDYDTCCDGSEEYSAVGGIKCANKCDEIGKEWRRVEEEKQKSFERSAKKRKTMVKEAKEMRRRVETKIETLKGEIKTLEARKRELQTKFNEIQRQEKGKIVKQEGSGGKLGNLKSVTKKRISELRDALQTVVDQRDDLHERVKDLEGILRKFKEEYNPNFNDEGVKQAVKSWEDYAANLDSEGETEAEFADVEEVLKEDNEERGVNWKEFEEEETADTDIRKTLERHE
jgi:protein kinase C substrate 80K-H